MADPTPLDDLIAVAGGTFRMGSDDFYPDEAPAHERTVGPFELDRTPVTNAAFARFVAATGHVTVAERALDPAEHPGTDPADLAPGSLVFTPTEGPVDLRDWRAWWRWVPGADWRHPRGPGSSIEGLDDHPVVQVAHPDALAYAAWAGKRLPTEAELEYASAAGRTPAPYAWGAERDVDGVDQANTWRGPFPHGATGPWAATGTSPVEAHPANPWGFHDLIGNVWAWTSTPYAPRHRHPDDAAAIEAPATCCAPNAALLAATAQSREPGSAIDRHVLKGGSHLCAPEYCLRYRPAARSPQADDSATTHIGFRCAR